MARLREQDAARRAASGYGPDFLEAFARGLRVIAAFGREKKQLSLSDVARATDLPKPSVRRALYTLTCLGLATSDGRTFRLTPKVMESVARRAIQIHGALGTTYDMPLTNMFAHGVMLALADGPTEVHLTTVAKQVLRDHKGTDGMWPTEFIPNRRAAAERELLGIDTSPTF